VIVSMLFAGMAALVSYCGKSTHVPPKQAPRLKAGGTDK